MCPICRAGVYGSEIKIETYTLNRILNTRPREISHAGFYLAEYEEARVRISQSPAERKQATTKYGGVASSTLASATKLKQ